VQSKIGTATFLGLYQSSWFNNEFPNINLPALLDSVENKLGQADNHLNELYNGFFEPGSVTAVQGEMGEKRSGYSHVPDLYAAFWFHPDHLGSSNYITNLAGNVSQHMEYLPFGETLVEEHLNSNNSPYKFNGKELDEETGNYYYGARYYDPKFSIWLSVDPLAGKYPGWSPYNYVLQNPVKLVDPDGKGPTDHWILNDSGKLILDERTNDDFNVFYDENGNKLFQTNKQIDLHYVAKTWGTKMDEYENKLKTVFIEIATEPEVYNKMEQRAKETGFDESIMSLKDMKSQGQYHKKIGPVMGAIDVVKEAPKWFSNPGSAVKSIIQQGVKSGYKGFTGTDFVQDISKNLNKIWNGMQEFGDEISNGSYIDYFKLK